MRAIEDARVIAARIDVLMDELETTADWMPRYGEIEREIERAAVEIEAKAKQVGLSAEAERLRRAVEKHIRDSGPGWFV